jgi:hypothetical protein
MSITRLQQARQMYAMGQRVAKTLDGSRPGYRGDDAYGSSSRSSQATSSRAATSSTNSSAPGGDSGQETRGDGPSTPTRTTLPGNIGSNESFTLSSDPMDLKEQYNIGNLSTTIPGGPTFVNIDNPYMAKGLETNRYNNYLDSQNLRGSTFNPVKTPSVFVNTLANLAGGLGYKKNTQFFADNVAGKYGYGYGVEDYEKYMKDRLGGLTNAYGRTLNEGEIGYRSNDGENGSGGIMDVYTDDTADDTKYFFDDTTTEDEFKKLVRFLGEDSTLDPAAAGVANTDELRAMILERAKNLYT